MLARLELGLKLSEPIPIGYLVKGLHGILYNSFRGLPEADEKHASNIRPPFTINSIKHYNNKKLTVKITFLAETFLMYAWKMFQLKKHIELEGKPTEILFVKIVEVKKYLELISKNYYSQAINFKTPTTFINDKVTTPLPIPQNIIKSLMRTWLEYSKLDIPKSFEKAVYKLAITDCDICTAFWYYGNIPIKGFIGKAVVKPVSNKEEYNRFIGTLLNLAEYTGIGAKTGFGMGQVKLDSSKIIISGNKN